jgi:hypothetical protein
VAAIKALLHIFKCEKDVNLIFIINPAVFIEKLMRSSISPYMIFASLDNFLK